MMAGEEWPTSQRGRIEIASIGSEVMRATNSWAELDGRLVVGHQLSE